MVLFCLAFGSAIAIDGPSASAGKYNSVLNIGDSAPQWTELPGTDGKKHSSQSFDKAAALVVAFTCNSCPYSVDVEDRLNQLAQKYKSAGVAVVAINVNKVEEDLLPAMKARAKEKGFDFPYLFDASQSIAKEFGAKYTPEFFVFNKERRLVYMGSFDDSPDGKNVKKNHVIDAIDAVLDGQPIELKETVPVGCRIRFERQRRRRSR